jgi:hypothetical protein
LHYEQLISYESARSLGLATGYAFITARGLLGTAGLFFAARQIKLAALSTGDTTLRLGELGRWFSFATGFGFFAARRGFNATRLGIAAWKFEHAAFGTRCTATLGLSRIGLTRNHERDKQTEN